MHLFGIWKVEKPSLEFVGTRRGEGLSGHCATSPGAHEEVDDGSEWQHGVLQLWQETAFWVTDPVRLLHLSSSISFPRPLGCGGCVAGKFIRTSKALRWKFSLHMPPHRKQFGGVTLRKNGKDPARHTSDAARLSRVSPQKVTQRVSSCGRWARSGPRLGHRLDLNATGGDVKWSRRITEAGRT